MSISLLDRQQRRLCMVTFSVHGGPLRLALSIGGLQSVEPTLGTDVIRTATRQMYGARPRNFVMLMMYAFANAYDIEQLLAIDNNAHLKHRPIKSSYDELWQELGGSVHTKFLPLTAA